MFVYGERRNFVGALRQSASNRSACFGTSLPDLGTKDAHGPTRMKSCLPCFTRMPW